MSLNDYTPAGKLKQDAFLSKINYGAMAPFEFAADVSRQRQQDAFGWGYTHKQADKAFPYIMYHEDAFRSIMRPLLKDKSCHSFIDVGCGAGDKVQQAKRLAPKVHCWGVERDPMSVMWGEAFGVENLICADAFSLDYSNWDLIYAYWPIPDSKLMLRLVRHIQGTMRTLAKFVIVGWSHPSMDHCRMPNPDFGSHLLLRSE